MWITLDISLHHVQYCNTCPQITLLKFASSLGFFCIPLHLSYFLLDTVSPAPTLMCALIFKEIVTF